MNSKIWRSFAVYVLLIFLALSFAHQLANKERYQEFKYTEFLQLLSEGKISNVIIVDGTVTGALKDGTKFTTMVPDDPNLYSRLVAAGAEVTFQKPPEPPWWLNLLAYTVLPGVLLLAMMYYMTQQTQGGGRQVMNFGRSRARLQSEVHERITFADVAGCEEAKEELAEIVDFLKFPKKYAEIGARIPKGVLLFGPPGTGKTYIARAVAGEAGVPFLSISGSDFVEMFVGVGAARVRDLFEQAKKRAPAIIFIDEIDAVGRMRGAGMGGGHDEREQTLNQLLVEMDGFSANQGIIVMAATNRPDILDPALLRPGRFDRHVVLDRPDLQARVEILKIHSRGKPLAKEVDLEVLAKRTPGFTPADLENVMNEAALLAARKRKRRIGMEELEEAIKRVVAGPKKKSRIISEKEKRVVAFHEAAHAIVAKKLPNSDPVQEVSIIPRGVTLGHVLQLPVEDKYLITKAEIIDRVTSALAGRAAEEMVFGEVSSGAANDLEHATKLVRRMIMEFGMSEKLGPLTFGRKEGQVFLGRDLARERDFSEEVAAAIDREEREIISRCYERAREILSENRETLNRVAEALLEKETLKADELEELLKGASSTHSAQSDVPEGVKQEAAGPDADLREGSGDDTHLESAKKVKGQIQPVPEAD
ncbi:MAG TPA: ATP-dependent metallopeptidase FtsH/Yme1/Tma family protein [Firmicutes bacterium]|nr:ATP-dependent metallopeptidase FtsH/Yme1/Tma family protein [Candidatus Fermentithermobacillaceae bacterium]